ncbi:MAG: hypothetical protein HC821_04640 [Lewinella sp.]|nr:hypothetical protein [Lewinella sp.]
MAPAAAEHHITAVESNLYNIDERYFIRLPKKSDFSLRIHQGPRGPELLATSSKGQTLEYDILW